MNKVEKNVDVLENISPHFLKWLRPLLSNKSHCSSMVMWKWKNKNMNIQIVKTAMWKPTRQTAHWCYKTTQHRNFKTVQFDNENEKKISTKKTKQIES